MTSDTGGADAGAGNAGDGGDADQPDPDAWAVALGGGGPGGPPSPPPMLIPPMFVRNDSAVLVASDMAASTRSLFSRSPTVLPPKSVINFLSSRTLFAAMAACACSIAAVRWKSVEGIPNQNASA